VSSSPLPVTFTDGCAVVSLPPEIDALNAEPVSVALRSALAEWSPGVVADMTATSFSDAAGIRAVVRAHHRAEEQGCCMRVVIPHPAVRRVAGLTGAESLLHTYPSLDDALPSGQDAPAGQADQPEQTARIIPCQPHFPELASPQNTGQSMPLQLAHRLTAQLHSHAITRRRHTRK
jgi:anti-anti-sigma factor